MKYVVNKCHGGFGLPYKALLRLYELGHPKVARTPEQWYGKSYSSSYAEDLQEFIACDNPKDMEMTLFTPDHKNILYWSPSCGLFGECERNDPLLVQVVEELGEEANGQCANLKIVDVPDGILIEITDYDGWEGVRERSRHFG